MYTHTRTEPYCVHSQWENISQWTMQHFNCLVGNSLDAPYDLHTVFLTSHFWNTAWIAHTIDTPPYAHTKPHCVKVQDGMRRKPSNGHAIKGGCEALPSVHRLSEIPPFLPLIVQRVRIFYFELKGWCYTNYKLSISWPRSSGTWAGRCLPVTNMTRITTHDTHDNTWHTWQHMTRMTTHDIIRMTCKGRQCEEEWHKGQETWQKQEMQEWSSCKECTHSVI